MSKKLKKFLLITFLIGLSLGLAWGLLLGPIAHSFMEKMVHLLGGKAQ